MPNLITLITPTNLLSEKEQFLASHTYNPTFSYPWIDDPGEISFRNPAKQTLLEAIKLQDHDAISLAAQRLFEVTINQQDLDAALIVAQAKGIRSPGSAAEYAHLVKEALAYFALTDIQVIETEEAGFNARPNHQDKTITISKHIHFDYFSMEGGVRHELVHVLRYRNGLHNQVKRSSRYLPTEEGLASWCQDNTNDDNGAAQHAMEYVASSVGLKGSLRDVFNCLSDLGMSSELAWKRASRHKFGFIDTSQPGDILKPAMYYANEIKVAKLTQGEKLRLFVGKIALDELEDHPTYTGLWPAEKIITYFNL